MPQRCEKAIMYTVQSRKIRGRNDLKATKQLSLPVTLREQLLEQDQGDKRRKIRTTGAHQNIPNNGKAKGPKDLNNIIEMENGAYTTTTSSMQRSV
mgnify:CR=1 FL=1